MLICIGMSLLIGLTPVVTSINICKNKSSNYISVEMSNGKKTAKNHGRSFSKALAMFLCQ